MVVTDSASDFWIGVANAASAVGMFFFAGVQVWLAKRAETKRLRERELDKQDQIDGAYGVVWAEYNRIWRLSEQVGSADVVLAVYTGILGWRDVLPRDWAQSTASLGQLGLVSAELGAVGYSILHDVATRIRRLESSLERASARIGSTFQFGHLMATR